MSISQNTDIIEKVTLYKLEIYFNFVAFCAKYAKILESDDENV